MEILIDDLLKMIKWLEVEHLRTVNKSEMELIVSMKARIGQIIRDIEDGIYGGI